jgi:hypothetical protein
MADQITLTDAQVQDAIAKLTAQLKTDRAANSAFCDCWPCAKRILNLLKTVVPAPVKTVIDLLIKIGDGIASSVCK